MFGLRTLIIWLTLAFACFLPASALAPTAPENCIWEIFSIGYDAPVTEATDLGNRTETSTSNYDSAPISRAITEKILTATERSLFGPNAEFKAADTVAPDLFRGTSEGFPGLQGTRGLERTPTSTDPAVATVFATESSNYGTGVLHIASSEGLPIVESNVLAGTESEVVLGMTPTEFAARADTTITAAQARSILSSMGISIPGRISRNAFDEVLANTPRLTPAQIQQFTNAARAGGGQ